MTAVVSLGGFQGTACWGDDPTPQGLEKEDLRSLSITLGAKKKAVEAVWKRMERMPFNNKVEEVLVRSWCLSFWQPG